MKDKIIGTILKEITFILVMCTATLLFSKAVEYIHEKSQNEKIKKEAVTEHKTKEGKYIRKIDWDKLQGYHVVAWIKCGKYIDYPVVQGESDYTYLHANMYMNYDINGSIFMESSNSNKFLDMNTIIYGHNMRSGAMFGTLKRFFNVNYTKEHKFYIWLPDGTQHTYDFFSIANTTYNSKYYDIKFKTKKEYKAYQEYLLSTSSADFKKKADTDRRIVTLSTCASTGSYLGRRVCLTGIESEVLQVQPPQKSWHS